MTLPQAKFQLTKDKIRDPSISQEQAYQHWNTIREAIQKIYNKQASTLSYEELYRTAYNLVLHKHGELLYTGVRSTTIELLQPMIEQLLQCSEDDILKKMNEIWQQSKLCIVMIKDILMYMDKNYVPKQKIQSIEQLQTSQFKHYVVLNPQIKAKFISKIICEVKTERDGGIVDIPQLRRSISMLVEVGMNNKKIYESEFEKVFIQETENYYKMESNSLVMRNNCYTYLQKAKNRLNEELERSLNYLDSSSEKILIKTFLQEAIATHAHTLISMETSGLNHMLKYDCYEEVALMYEMFSKVGESFQLLKEHLQLFIEQEGNKLVVDANLKEDQFVSSLIELRQKLISFFGKSFQRDSNIDLTIKTSFEKFINLNERTAKCLVSFLDEKFKKDFKGMHESEINDTLDKVISLFRYLQDKDIFEGHYKCSLAKRLLEQRSANEDAEKLLIKKLKEECGFQFTQKLEVMFKDIKMSDETMNEFRNTQLAKKLTLDMSVKILTTGNWPNDSKDNTFMVILPKEIQFCISSFNKFYTNKHTGRLLTWKTNQGCADLRAILGDANEKHELTVSTYQMCILMLFNTHSSMDYQSLMNLSQIPETDLKCNLIPLVSKVNILTKFPNTREFQPNDQYSLNPAYKSSFFKIKVPVAQAKENKTQEKQEISEKVDEDRRHMVEAAIVKVMKTRRRLDHNSLIAESTKQLRTKFNPDPLLIKKRIESLIEREYLERDPDDRRYYKYIA